VCYFGGCLIPDRNIWFRIIADLYSRTSQTIIPCHNACPDLLCETTDAEQVLFLPYELNYIQDQLKLFSNPFEAVALNGPAYGFMSGICDCPYFKSPECLIHNLRPFDCRSFPILPIFNPDGSVDFQVSPYCPLSCKLAPDFFQLITSRWRDITPRLPEAWKVYYNFHCSKQPVNPLHR
jgi:Fe-S-cluster containining protein